MIYTILDAIEFALEEQGEPQSPYCLSSQLNPLGNPSIGYSDDVNEKLKFARKVP